jgi:hypothetical protein
MKISSDLYSLSSFGLLEVCFCKARSSKQQQILAGNADVLLAVLVCSQRYLEQG